MLLLAPGQSPPSAGDHQWASEARWGKKHVESEIACGMRFWAWKHLILYARRQACMKCAFIRSGRNQAKSNACKWERCLCIPDMLERCLRILGHKHQPLIVKHLVKAWRLEGSGLTLLSRHLAWTRWQTWWCASRPACTHLHAWRSAHLDEGEARALHCMTRRGHAGDRDHHPAILLQHLQSRRGFEQLRTTRMTG
eukprot:scaffold193561_cov19-Tisochrysis_lutea.AAC.1